MGKTYLSGDLGDTDVLLPCNMCVSCCSPLRAGVKALAGCHAGARPAPHPRGTPAAYTIPFTQ